MLPPPPCSSQLPASADHQTIRGQRIELHLLARLNAGGCGDRIVKPMATFRYAGEWFDDPEVRENRWYEVSQSVQVCRCAALGWLGWSSTRASCVHHFK